jgi:hypothetical protein
MDSQCGIAGNEFPAYLKVWTIVRPFFPIQPNNGAFKVNITKCAANARGFFKI